MQRLKSSERKRETRQKIQWGGLLKKAELEFESTAVLYGLLLEAKEKLSGSQAKKYRQEWFIKGDIAFTEEARLNR